MFPFAELLNHDICSVDCLQVGSLYQSQWDTDVEMVARSVALSLGCFCGQRDCTDYTDDALDYKNLRDF